MILTLLLQSFPMNSTPCLCGSNISFDSCCGRFLTKTEKTDTAEQLMRSRFTAFCLNDHQYLADTHHPNKRQPHKSNELDSSQTKTIWIKLDIHHTIDGLHHNNTGKVQFSATFNEQGEFFELLETSSFIKEKGQWMYVDGQPIINSVHFKLKRNEPCWCGSGLKYKTCHLT